MLVISYPLLMNQSTYTVDTEHHGQRLDVFLADVAGKTRSHIQKCLMHGTITVNDVPPKKSGQVVHEGEVITLGEIVQQYSGASHTPVVDTAIYSRITVVSETPDYITLFKPAGLLIHPTEAGEQVTLADWIVRTYPEIASVGEDPLRPGIVHRLDKDASGILVVARTQAMFVHLKKQFKKRTIQKEYVILVHGVIANDTDTIDFDIDRGNDGRMVSRPKLKAITLKTVDAIQDGKSALTEFTVRARYARFTLLDVRIHTGRTHQIRVHMYAYNHPVVGDTVYKQKKNEKKHDMALDRLFLHARKLCFQDLTDTEQCFEVELPEELQTYLATLV